jgi:hypothetical protein
MFSTSKTVLKTASIQGSQEPQKEIVDMGADMIGGAVNAVGGPAVDALAEKVGVPKELVNQFKPVIIGLVVAGIARMLKQPGGASKMQNMIDASTKAVGSADPADFIKNVDPEKSMDILGQMAGGNSVDNVVNNLAGKTGIDAKQLTGVLGSVAPLVLAGLGGMQAKNGWSTEQLAGGITEGVGTMKDLGVVDYVLDNTPGVGDDIKRGLSSLFGG